MGDCSLPPSLARNSISNVRKAVLARRWPPDLFPSPSLFSAEVWSGLVELTHTDRPAVGQSPAHHNLSFACSVTAHATPPAATQPTDTRGIARRSQGGGRLAGSLSLHLRHTLSTAPPLGKVGSQPGHPAICVVSSDFLTRDQENLLRIFLPSCILPGRRTNPCPHRQLHQHANCLLVGRSLLHEHPTALHVRGAGIRRKLPRRLRTLAASAFSVARTALAHPVLIETCLRLLLWSLAFGHATKPYAVHDSVA